MNAYRPPCSKSLAGGVPTLAGGYLPWPGYPPDVDRQTNWNYYLSHPTDAGGKNSVVLVKEIVTASVSKTLPDTMTLFYSSEYDGKLCFHRCLSVNKGGGGTTPQPGLGYPPARSGLGEWWPPSPARTGVLPARSGWGTSPPSQDWDTPSPRNGTAEQALANWWGIYLLRSLRGLSWFFLFKTCLMLYLTKALLMEPTNLVTF